MSMSPRVVTAVAVLTAALAGSAGRASAQYPPEAGPQGGQFGGYPGAPGMMPGGPTGDPGFAEGPSLPTDSLGSPGGGGAHGPRAWVGAEYLLYWTKDASIPFPVASVGPAAGAGILGSSGAQLLYGNTTMDFNNFSGIRVIGGYWITNNESVGIEGNFFMLPKKRASTPTLTGSDILPVLARPFFDTANNRQSSRVLSKPGQFIGNIQTTSGLELWGAEVGPVWRARDNGRWTLDAIAAFKFLSLNESLTIADTANALNNGVSVLQGRAFGNASTLSVRDEFRTTNNFYGATIGARGNIHVEAFTWSVTGKLGLGTMESKVQATGTSTLSGGATPPLTSIGGFYASGANLGTFDRSHFAVIPEFSSNLNVQITSHLAVNIGYNYLYINNVLRPGDQINGRINPNGIPTSPNFGARTGPTGPTIPLANSDFWAQGFNLAFIVGY